MARASEDNDESPAGGAGAGTSLTAVRLLLAFLNVSLVARGRAAEGNRGRGLTVMGVNPPEGCGVVADADAEGNGIAVGVVANLGRPVPGGYTSLFRGG